VYLNGFDHFIKEQLKVAKYVRYVDDFALFSNNRQVLQAARIALEEYLATLRIKIHPVKSQLFETKHGASFLGFRVLPRQIRVRVENLRRARRRLRQLQTDYAERRRSLGEVTHPLRSWVAHLEHGNTWRLREQIFATLVFTRK
jgi:retron-type reverse transcriptase